MRAAAIEIKMIYCESNQLEEGIIASARANLQPITAVTWVKVQKETARDSSMLELIKLASKAFQRFQENYHLFYCHIGD